MYGFNKFLTFDIDKIRYIVPIEYVSYIIASTDPFPCVQSAEKGEKSYIDRILNIERELITVIEITGLWKGYIAKKKK
ncbi:MAG: hypothetical protein NC452_11990 [Eubacterium sp.]|nr:hypothetical protein [Eubacterium sp.]